jgi:glutathione S-transferase
MAAAMGTPTVFGAGYSVYVRAVRLALEEKGVPYRLQEVDVFAAGGPPPDYRLRHPFRRIPAFEHDGFRLYEAGAITRYIDEVFPGPALMPATPEARARVNQIISILDGYAYRTWVWDIFVERVNIPSAGGEPDESKIADALPRAETCLAAIEDLMQADGYFLGSEPTLADLHAAPMIAVFRRAPEGERMLAGRPRWQGWWHRMRERPSMAATRSPGQAGRE